MAAQTLDQVLNSLSGVYQPQLDSVAQQQAALPAQFQAQEQGLGASKDQAFGDILNGARSRGTGVAFGGIPLGEQAQYTASTYLPALANLKTSQNNASQSLIDAINKINEDKFSTANNIYQFGVQADQAQQGLDEQKANDLAQQAAAARAAAGSSQFSPTLGSGTAPAAAASGGTLTGGKSSKDADSAVRSLIDTNNAGTIVNTINAISQSASRGNTYDQAKLQLLQRYMPGWFVKSSVAPGQLTFNASYINNLAAHNSLKNKV